MQDIQKIKKSDNWGSEEQNVLITKAFEFLPLISMDRKDAKSLERKKLAWEVIADSVNEVNLTGSKRSGKDTSAKWQQIKCKAGGDLDQLNTLFKDDEVRQLKLFYHNCINLL